MCCGPLAAWIVISPFFRRKADEGRKEGSRWSWGSRLFFVRSFFDFRWRIWTNLSISGEANCLKLIYAPCANANCLKRLLIPCANANCLKQLFLYSLAALTHSLLQYQMEYRHNSLTFEIRFLVFPCLLVCLLPSESPLSKNECRPFSLARFVHIFHTKVTVSFIMNVNSSDLTASSLLAFSEWLFVLAKQLAELKKPLVSN